MSHREEGLRGDAIRPTGRARDPHLLTGARALFSMLAFSPRASAAVAQRLFLRPRRFERPGWETEALESATPFTFPVEDGTELRAWSWGEGETVALVHGWEGRGSQLAAMAEPLVERGYRVVTFDAPGHGDSPGEETSAVRFAEALVGLDRWMGGLHGVVAHSFGALATGFALPRGLDPARLVFLSPGISPRAATSHMARLLGFGPGVLKELRSRIEEVGGIALDEIEEARIFSELDRPLLIVHDRGDPEVPLDDVEALAVETDARVLWTEGLGHRGVLRDPEVAARVAAFVDADRPPFADGWHRFVYGELSMLSLDFFGDESRWPVG